MIPRPEWRLFIDPVFDDLMLKRLICFVRSHDHCAFCRRADRQSWEVCCHGVAGRTQGFHSGNASWNGARPSRAEPSACGECH
jgi:hypothetical protein